jgi:hypothetical protein
MTKTFLLALGLIVALGVPALACDGADCKDMTPEACKALCDAKAKQAKAKQTNCDGAAKSACGGYLAKLDAAAAKGCKSSKAQLAVLFKAFNTESPDVAAKGLADLGAKAAEGCKGSKTKLAKVKRDIFVVMPVSQQIERLVKGASKGCETSKAALASLGAECETGECTKSLVAKAKGLEANLKEGCDKSKAKLASMRKITLSTVAASAPAKGKKVGDCGGCETAKPKPVTDECGGCETAPTKKASNK